MADIVGTSGADNLVGTDDGDLIWGLAGDDVIHGGDGNDTILGHEGNDTLYGDGGNDILEDHLGANIFYGGWGFNIYYVTFDPVPLDHIEISRIFGDTEFGATDLAFTSGRLRLNGDGTITARDGFHVLIMKDVDFIDNSGRRELDTKFVVENNLRDLNSDGFADITTFSHSENTIYFDLTDPNLFVQHDRQRANYLGSGDLFIAPNFRVYSPSLILDTVTGTISGGSFSITPSSGYRPVGSGDIDGDIAGDIFLQDSANGQILIKFGSFISSLDYELFNGSSGYVSPNDDWLLDPIGAEWKMVAARDFDRDGDDDILLRRDTDGLIYIWYTESRAITGGTNFGAIGTDWTIAGTGDFNNDGFYDIALKNTTTGQFYLLLMNSAGSYTGSNLGVIGTNWTIAATGDYNGDGTDDLLWRNANTNQIYMWAMQDGHQAATGSAPYGYLAADQIIV
jgi:hypothetical protein